MNDEKNDWAIALGVAILLTILSSIALVAAGGWEWFAKFVESAAPAWIQAVGSVAAIWAAIWLGRRSEAEAGQGARTHYLIFKSSARTAIASAMQAARERDLAGVRYGRSLICDAIQLGQTVPLQRLTRHNALVAARYRAVVSMAGAVSDASFTGAWQEAELRFLANELGQLLDDLDKAEEYAGDRDLLST